MGKVIQLKHAHLQPLDEFGFYARLAEVSGDSIVFFTRQGCASCRAWKRLLQDYARQQDIPVFEVDVEQNMALASEYELFHLPALFLFKDGEFHSELQSEARLPLFHQAVRQASLAPAQDAP